MVYSAADGIVEQVGDVKLANVLIVATGSDLEAVRRRAREAAGYLMGDRNA